MRSAIAGGAVLLTSLLYLARRCGALAALTARWQQHGTAGAVTAAQLLLAPPSRGATSLHSAVARGARAQLYNVAGAALSTDKDGAPQTPSQTAAALQRLLSRTVCITVVELHRSPYGEKDATVRSVRHHGASCEGARAALRCRVHVVLAKDRDRYYAMVPRLQL